MWLVGERDVAGMPPPLLRAADEGTGMLDGLHGEPVRSPLRDR